MICNEPPLTRVVVVDSTLHDAITSSECVYVCALSVVASLHCMQTRTLRHIHSLQQVSSLGSLFAEVTQLLSTTFASSRSILWLVDTERGRLWAVKRRDADRAEGRSRSQPPSPDRSGRAWPTRNGPTTSDDGSVLLSALQSNGNNTWSSVAGGTTGGGEGGYGWTATDRSLLGVTHEGFGSTGDYAKAVFPIGPGLVGACFHASSPSGDVGTNCSP